MIKVSHEVPLTLLEKSREFNDYDYALVHLFETYPEYYNFYKESLKMGREVLLDNSIFELGEAFDPDKFAYWIERLRPTKYIVPDVLDNEVGTVKNLHKWLEKYQDLPGKKIGVAQGETVEGFLRCYLEIGKYCDEIAISFNYKFYENLFLHLNTPSNWMYGRQGLLLYLEKTGLLQKKKKHHLLGCSLPQEFSEYSKKEWIGSIDTSNPVVHGLLGIKYSEIGLPDKQSIKLADLIESNISDQQLKDILFNIERFKQIKDGNNIR